MASVMGTDGSLRAMSRREFVAGQIAALEPFGLVVLAPPDSAAAAVEVACDEAGALTVALLRTDPAAGPVEGPTAAADAAAAADIADRLLRDVLATDDAAPLDVRHGSRRAEHEAGLKLAVASSDACQESSGASDSAAWFSPATSTPDGRPKPKARRLA